MKRNQFDDGDFTVSLDVPIPFLITSVVALLLFFAIAAVSGVRSPSINNNNEFVGLSTNVLKANLGNIKNAWPTQLVVKGKNWGGPFYPTNATPSRVAVIAGDGSLTNSADVDLTELETLNGVTSSIQAQLDSKATGVSGYTTNLDAAVNNFISMHGANEVQATSTNNLAAGAPTTTTLTLTNLSKGASCSISFYAPVVSTNQVIIAVPSGSAVRWLTTTNGNYDFIVTSNKFGMVAVWLDRETNVFAAYKESQ